MRRAVGSESKACLLMDLSLHEGLHNLPAIPLLDFGKNLLKMGFRNPLRHFRRLAKPEKEETEPNSTSYLMSPTGSELTYDSCREE